MDSWLIIIITLGFSAFFSGMEIAFISSNKLQVEIDKKHGRLPAQVISSLLRTPSRFIGSLLLGNTVAIVIYGIAMAEVLDRLIPMETAGTFLSLTVKTFLSTLLVLIAAEFLPKTLFRINPNLALNLLILPAWFFYLLFFPFIYLFTELSELLLSGVFRVRIREKKYVFGQIDLDDYVKQFMPRDLEESEDTQEIQMFRNAIDFRRVKLRECMVPRTEISALEDDGDLETLRQLFIKTGHSKIMIYNVSIDNIIGYAHSHDLFMNPGSIRAILRPVLIFPETMLAHEVLSIFTTQHKTVAVVVDEFGGTSGLVTLEDVMEEIFGEINDEFDHAALTEKIVREGEYIFSGRLEIDYLNEKYRLGLPESEDYETLAGLILHFHESIPAQDEEIAVPGFSFRILEATNTRVEKVRVRTGD